VICYISSASRLPYASLSTGVVASSVGSPRLGPLEVLLNDSGLLLDIVSLGVLDGKVEVVENGVYESNDGNTDYPSAYNLTCEEKETYIEPKLDR
jgi:hypothetical protein